MGKVSDEIKFIETERESSKLVSPSERASKFSLGGNSWTKSAIKDLEDKQKKIKNSKSQPENLIRIKKRKINHIRSIPKSPKFI